MPCTPDTLDHSAVRCQCSAIGIGLSKGSDSDVLPGLTCPSGMTVQIGTLDAAQNPSCVKCGGQSQFACSESIQPTLTLHQQPLQSSEAHQPGSLRSLVQSQAPQCMQLPLQLAECSNMLALRCSAHTSDMCAASQVKRLLGG